MLNRFNRILSRQPAVSWAPLALVAGYAWILLLWHLSVFWRVLQDYEYGWAVPILVLALLWRRKGYLPSPEPRASAVAFSGVFLCTLLLLPLRVVLDANLDWRPAVWALAAVAVTLALCAIHLAGGKPWLAALAFPILFVLSGVPWPGRLELPVTSGLMQFGAFVATELLNLIGVAACQRGSVVETAAGLIGVDEACSGIKSLQTMVAVGLFLSEFTAWRGPKRLLIVLMGAALATASNLGRLVLLAWVGSQAGPGGIERWHDAAGTVAFTAACLALVAIVRKLPPAPSGPPLPPQAPAPPAFRPSWALAGLALCVPWLGATELIRLYWFEPRQVTAEARWRAVWPQPFNGAGSRVLPVSEAVRNQLQCDAGSAVRWSDQPGTEWVGYFFEWRQGLRAYFARAQHSPEICLPATGRRLLKDLGFFDHRTSGRLIRVHHLLFEDESGPLNVFFIMDGSSVRDNNEQLHAGSAATRLRNVWERHKGADRRSLELIAAGYPTPPLARADAQRWLTAIIRPENRLATL